MCTSALQDRSRSISTSHDITASYTHSKHKHKHATLATPIKTIKTTKIINSKLMRGSCYANYLQFFNLPTNMPLAFSATVKKKVQIPTSPEYITCVT